MPSQFHKRHYERVAEAMQEATRRASGEELNGHAMRAIGIAIEELADVFAGDNGLFKRDRFLLACIPGNNVRARS